MAGGLTFMVESANAAEARDLVTLVLAIFSKDLVDPVILLAPRGLAVFISKFDRKVLLVANFQTTEQR